MQLWRDEGGIPRLCASRCPRCGRISFPVSTMCRTCGEPTVETVALERDGTVEAASRMGKLVLVHVRTDDGVRVLGQLASGDDVRVGTRVRFSPSDGKLSFEVYA